MSAWALKDAEISCGEVFERAFGGEPQVVARCGVKVAQVFNVAIAVAVEFLVLHDALVLSPWVTDEEREFVKKRVSRIETIPGTPVSEMLQNQHRTPPKVQVLRPKALEKKQP